MPFAGIGPCIACRHEYVSIIFRDISTPSFTMLVSELRHEWHGSWGDLFIEDWGFEGGDVDFMEGRGYIHDFRMSAEADIRGRS